MNIEITRVLDDHLLNGDHNVSSSEVQNESVVASLSVLAKHKVRYKDEKGANETEQRTSETDPVNREKSRGLRVAAVLIHRFYLINHKNDRNYQTRESHQARILQTRRMGQ